MTRPSVASLRAAFVVLVVSIGLAGCATTSGGEKVTRVRMSERECMARVMYFESNRSSDDGMLAVGTVVVNRLKSGRHGSTVCEVVGQRNQFAPGVMTRPMNDRGADRARRMADAVFAGKRHAGAQTALFFHTYGYRYPYRNMRYVLVAGGNAFYEKRKPPMTPNGEGVWPGPPAPSDGVGASPIMVAAATPRSAPEPRRAPEPKPIVVASLQPSQDSWREPPVRDAWREPSVRETPARRAPVRETSTRDAGRTAAGQDLYGRQDFDDAPARDWRDQPVREAAREPSGDAYRQPSRPSTQPRREARPEAVERAELAPPSGWREGPRPVERPRETAQARAPMDAPSRLGGEERYQIQPSWRDEQRPTPRGAGSQQAFNRDRPAQPSPASIDDLLDGQIAPPMQLRPGDEYHPR